MFVFDQNCYVRRVFQKILGNGAVHKLFEFQSKSNGVLTGFNGSFK